MKNLQVEVVDAKNLTQSKLIEKNLYSRISYGDRTSVSPGGVKFAATFQCSTLTDSVCIALKNRQTDTPMYVRDIPLEHFTDNPDWRGWIDLYAQGDPRNKRFVAGVSDAKIPQMEIALSFGEIPSSMPNLSAQEIRGEVPAAHILARHSMPSAHRDVAEAQWMAAQVSRAIGLAPAAQSQQQVSVLRENVAELKLQLDGALNREAQLNEEREWLRQEMHSEQGEFSSQSAKLQQQLHQAREDLEQSRDIHERDMQANQDLLSNTQSQVRVMEKELDLAAMTHKEHLNREVELERNAEELQEQMRFKDENLAQKDTEILRVHREVAAKQILFDESRSQCLESEEAAQQESALQVELRRVMLESHERESSLLDDLQVSKDKLSVQEKQGARELQKMKAKLLETEHINSKEMQKVKTEASRRNSQLEEELRRATGDFTAREKTLIAQLDDTRNQVSDLEVNLQHEIDRQKRHHSELEWQLEQATSEAEAQRIHWEKELDVTRVDFGNREEELRIEVQASNDDLVAKLKELDALRHETATRKCLLDEVTEETQRQVSVMDDVKRDLDIAQRLSTDWKTKFEVQKDDFEEQLQILQNEKNDLANLNSGSKTKELLFNERATEMDEKCGRMQQELRDAMQLHDEFSNDKALLEEDLAATRYTLQEKQMEVANLACELKDCKSAEVVIHDSLSQTQRALNEKCACVHSLREKVSDQDANVVVLQAVVADKDSQLVALQDKLSATNGQFEQDTNASAGENQRLSRELHDQVTCVQELEAKVATQDMALKGALAQVEDLNQTVAASAKLQSITENMTCRLQALELDLQKKVNLLDETTTICNQRQSTIVELRGELNMARKTEAEDDEKEKSMKEKVDRISEQKEAVVYEMFSVQSEYKKTRAVNEQLAAEVVDLKTRNNRRSSEADELTERCKAYEGRLESQLEHAEYQEEVIGELEGTNQSLDFHNLTLSQALQQRDETNVWLQKENDLIMQQISNGPTDFSDLLLEMRELKSSGSASYWKQKCLQAESRLDEILGGIDHGTSANANGQLGDAKYVMMNTHEKVAQLPQHPNPQVQASLQRQGRSRVIDGSVSPWGYAYSQSSVPDAYKHRPH